MTSDKEIINQAMKKVAKERGMANIGWWKNHEAICLEAMKLKEQKTRQEVQRETLQMVYKDMVLQGISPMKFIRGVLKREGITINLEELKKEGE